MENTILNDLQGIFGDKPISFDDFKKGLEDKKIKLGNLESGNYIAKERYNKLEEEYKTLETKNKELMDMSEKHQKEIAKLNKESISKEEYDKRMEEIQAKHKGEIDTLKKGMEEAQRNSIISNFLDKYPIAPNCKEFVMGKLDKNIIIVDGDKVLGLDDQMKNIMENYSSLFIQSKPAGATPNAAGTSSANPPLPTLSDDPNERVNQLKKMKEEDPTSYKNYMASKGLKVN